MLTVQLDAVTCDTTAQEGLRDVINQIRTAKRIVVVCGAGISTAAGIPDFRSASGLFSSGEKGKGHAQDLFHVRSLTSSTLLPAHHALLNELASLSHSAEPSVFHHLLARLDGQGRLLRCYTQNIDGLESRAGLETGIPPSTSKAKSGKTIRDTLKSTPRCIPLHGQLEYLHCPLCSTTALISDHLPLPPHSLACPTCDLASSIRQALSERSRKSGYLRASVVLYGEEHPQGEAIGSVVERDLKGTGRKGEKEGQVDLLLVAGTSLSIPGVKRIVKEMARSLRSRAKSKSKGKGPKTILINREIPKGAEWQGVFDTFICGDIQEFAAHCADPPGIEAVRPTPLKRKLGKAESTPKKISQINPYPTPSPTPLRKRPKITAEPVTPTKPRLEPISELPDTPLSMEKSIVTKSPYATTPESLEKKTYNYELPDSPTSLKSRSLSLSPLPARFDGA